MPIDNVYNPPPTATVISTSTGSGLISGGQAYNSTGLTFIISKAEYIIGGATYTSAEQTVTLDAAHATLERFDLLYLDTSGLAGAVKGTASATPSRPDVDPTTQIGLAFVDVPATATTPGTVTNENVYLEDTEWTSATSGTGWTKASTSNPYAGTKCIEGTSVAAAAYVHLTRSSSADFSSYKSLNMFVRSKAAWAKNRVLKLQFYIGTVAVGGSVVLQSGFFGFDSSQTSAYQLVSIPMTNFAIPVGTVVDGFRITDVGGALGCYIDNIVLQTGATTGGGSTDLTAYMQKANNLSDLTSVVGATNVLAKDMLGLTPFTSTMVQNENVVIAANSTTTLQNISASGIMQAIHVVCDDNNVPFEGYLNIYIDGEGSPSIVIPFEALGIQFMWANTVQTRIESHEHISVGYSGANGCSLTFRYPIPFATSFKCDFVNPKVAETARVWAQFTYTTDVTDTRRLKASRTTAGGITVLVGDYPKTLLTIAAGHSGVLVAHSFIVTCSTNNTPLESNIEVFIDGSASASYESSGTEDWLLSQNYFTPGPSSSPCAYVSVVDSTNRRYAGGLDILKLWGGIKFSNGLVVKTKGEAAVNQTSVHYHWFAWYE